MVTTVEKPSGGVALEGKKTGKVVECPYILNEPILRNFAALLVFFCLLSSVKTRQLVL
jgi:hypothetical protein